MCDTPPFIKRKMTRFARGLKQLAGQDAGHADGFRVRCGLSQRILSHGGEGCQAKALPQPR